MGQYNTRKPSTHGYSVRRNTMTSKNEKDGAGAPLDPITNGIQRRADTQKRIEWFLEEYERDPNAIMKENVEIKIHPGKDDTSTTKVAIAVFHPTQKFLNGDMKQGGIREETYNDFKPFITSRIAKAHENHKAAVMKNSWIVKALSHSNMTDVFARKALPLDVYRSIKAHYISADDLEDLDDFDSFPHWKYDEEELQRLASKLATSEERKLAEKILQERTASTEFLQQERNRKDKMKEEVAPDFKLLKLATIDATPLQSQDLDETKSVHTLYIPQGEEIQDPRNPINVHGGGHWWVIEKDRILDVYNNGQDGDNWSSNNIQTAGAGAIGNALAKTDELVRALHRIKTNSSAFEAIH